VLNIRNAGLLTSFFILLDAWKRHTKAFETKMGQFFATGTSALMSFWFIWPLEFVKNQIQSENAEFGGNIRQRLANIMRTHGTLGIYRGIFAGS